jgi:hypothetical protein
MVFPVTCCGSVNVIKERINESLLERTMFRCGRNPRGGAVVGNVVNFRQLVDKMSDYQLLFPFQHPPHTEPSQPPQGHPFLSEVRANVCRSFSLSGPQVGQLPAPLPADGCVLSTHCAVKQTTCDAAHAATLSVSDKVISLWVASHPICCVVNTDNCW